MYPGVVRAAGGRRDLVCPMPSGSRPSQVSQLSEPERGLHVPGPADASFPDGRDAANCL